jgi:hypothetical protein
MEASGTLHILTAFSPSKNYSTHRTEGWVGPRGSLTVSVKRKSLSPARIRTLDHPAHSKLLYHTVIQALDNDSTGYRLFVVFPTPSSRQDSTLILNITSLFYILAS